MISLLQKRIIGTAWVQVMFYLGYFVMAIPAGLFINKYGYRKGVVFGLLLYGIGSLLSNYLLPKTIINLL